MIISTNNREKIMSPEDRNIQIEFIINVYKDTHGVKPRHIDFDSLSDIELDQMADTVADDAQALRDDESEDESAEEEAMRLYEQTMYDAGWEV